MRAQVRFEHTSPQEFFELPRNAQLSLRKAIEAIARDPLHPPAELDVVRLRDHPGYWRLAMGDHRVIYHADTGNIHVWFIENRTPETYVRLNELP